MRHLELTSGPTTSRFLPIHRYLRERNSRQLCVYNGSITNVSDFTKLLRLGY
jgi:hypothetical protein